MKLVLVALVGVILLVATVVEIRGHKKGAVHIRLSIEEFNEVGDVLTRPPEGYFGYSGYKLGETQGTIGDVLYQFSKVTESPTAGSITPNMTRSNINEDNRMSVFTELPDTSISGTLRLTRKNDVIYNGPFKLFFQKTTLESLGGPDEGLDVRTSESVHTLGLSFPDCVFNFDTVNFDNTLKLRVGKYMTDSEQMQMYQHLLCDTYHLKLAFAFKESKFQFNIMNHTVNVYADASQIKLIDNGIYITQIVTTSYNKGTIPDPADISYQTTEFPTSQDEYDPFEVAISVDSFDEIFDGLKQALGIGKRPLSVFDIVPGLNKDKWELDTNGLLIGISFPKMGEIFPNSTAHLSVTDAEFYFDVNEGEIRFHLDIDCNTLVTLNCDETRTYSAMNFTLNLVMPVQVGHDNEFLTLNMLGFGGTFTVLNSNIGHVVNEQLESLLSALPMYTSPSNLQKFNDKIRGIPIQELLPPGLYATVQNIKIVEDHVVIGGDLSKTDPMLKRIDRSKISWFGKPMNYSETMVIAKDKTPIALKPIEEQNCKPKAKSAKMTGASTGDTIHHGNGILLLIASVFLLLFSR